jgi:hypothetical protein
LQLLGELCRVGVPSPRERQRRPEQRIVQLWREGNQKEPATRAQLV